MIQGIFALILLFPFLSYLWYKLFTRKQKPTVSQNNGSYAVIVTAYRYSGNLDNVITSLLKLDYPHFHIYVVADDCNDYVYNGSKEKVSILYPNPPLKNQVKSHFLAIEKFVEPHNRIVIIDSDNLAHPQLLKALEAYFEQGYQAVQGVRTAKNTNTIFARLDAVNELYYLFYDRIILHTIGSSSMLSGSGMAFTTELYKDCLGKLDTEGAGFDKVLQKRILSKGHRIAFAKDAIVYDEKTAHADQLVKQRARWNNTWFRFFPYSLQLMGQGIAGFNMNKFLFGFILFRPPLFILLGIVSVFFLVDLFVWPIGALLWIIAGALFIVGFIIALKEMRAPAQLYTALTGAPKFIFLQILSLFKAKKANQLSVSTENTFHTDIETLQGKKESSGI